MFNHESELDFDYFDSEWYLNRYPDVAAAEIDPYEHYIVYGQKEGRHPHHIISIGLELQAWEGFSELALDELLQIFSCDHSSLFERLYSAWALGRWCASHDQWQDTLPYLNYIKDSKIPSQFKLPAHLLLIEAHLTLGDHGLATKVLVDAVSKFGDHPEFALALSNIMGSRAPTTNQDQQRLSVLNQIYHGSCLSGIKKAQDDVGLSLDNITAIHSRPATATGPKISIIVPTFNSEGHIKTSLSSLICQTWKNIEIIVVDDNSSDKTLHIVYEMRATDPRIVVLPQSINSGSYAARNAALSVATGEFIANHDSDDWSHPQRLEKQVRALLDDASKVAVLAHWVRCTHSLYFNRWRMEEGLIHSSVSTIMFRRSILGDLGGWHNVRVGGDSEFLSRILKIFGVEALCVLLPGIPLVYARHHASSLTSAEETHLRTQHRGVRRIYNDLTKRWHEISRIQDLKTSLDGRPRKFHIPSEMLRRGRCSHKTYDCVVFADMSELSATSEFIYWLIEACFKKGLTIGVHHWPTYGHQAPRPIQPSYLDHVLMGKYEFFSASVNTCTSTLFIVGSELLKCPPDTLPNVRYTLLELVSAQQQFEEFRLPVLDYHGSNKAIFESPLFNADWYLSAYPDVKAAGVDAFVHYTTYGWREGRAPSLFFDTQRYLSYLPEGCKLEVCALAHYIKLGKSLGYDPSYPDYIGDRESTSQRSIMICGHASGKLLFGAELSLIDLLQGYAGTGFNLYVTLPSSENAEYIAQVRRLCTRLIILPYSQWNAFALPCELTIVRFCEIIKKYDITAVHANTIMLREPLHAAKRLRISTLIHVRESLDHDPEICALIGLSAENIRKEVYRLADLIIANSKFTALRFGRGHPTHIVYNAIDFAQFTMANSIDPARINIAIISSNSQKKGICDFLEVSRLVQSKVPNARFILIGPHNEYVDGLLQDYFKSDQNNDLLIAGHSETPQHAVSQANIVVNLSNFEETFGRTLLEAMAAKRTVVAYDHGALPELVSHNLNGFLSPFKDVKAIADLLIHLCSNPSKIESMGNAGYEIAKNNYSIDNLTSNLLVAHGRIVDAIK